jgi:hypothetical protein
MGTGESLDNQLINLENTKVLLTGGGSLLPKIEPYKKKANTLGQVIKAEFT